MKASSFFWLVIILFIIPNIVNGQSNEGKEFWLGFMEHRDKGENTMVVMITSRVNTSGVISIPARGFTNSFTVTANDVTVIELPRNVETIGSEFVQGNAIKITAQADISVYMHQYFGMRSEASVALPRSSIGNAYYVVSFTGVPAANSFGANIDHPCEFLIVANEDETIINYTLTGNTQNGKQSGSTHTITLNEGEVYQVRADQALTDFTGTYIEGDKDFSLFAGTAWSQVPLGCTAMDNLLEQMYPVSTWGTRYVASPFANTSQDLYRVIASEDNTAVSIQGQFSSDISLDAGEYFDFQSSNGAFIEGDKPISVAQYIIGSACNGGVGDPSMVILNTVEQIRDTVTLFNSGFFNITENFINVICKEGEEDLVFLDNQNILASGVTFNTIGENSGFSFATISTVIGAHTLYTSGCGIIALAYGYGNVESYAYSGGASFVDINENPIPDGGCLNDTILFDTGLPEDRFAVEWDLGDGTFSTAHKFEHIYNNLGTYPLSLIIEDFCFDEIDTLDKDILVSLRQDISVIEDQSGCVGTDITLGAFDLDGARFEWSGPNEFIADEQFPVVQNAQLGDAGIYEVVGNVSGCRTVPIDLGVEVFENPTPNLGMDTVICALDGDRITFDAGKYESYLWQDGSTDATLLAASNGDFSVAVTDGNGCIGIDTITLIRQCPTRFYIPNVFTPNDDGINDSFGISGIELIEFQLMVFDRWGQLVFKTGDESNKWNGQLKGQRVEEGEYIWILQYTGYLGDATIFADVETGSVLLTR